MQGLTRETMEGRQEGWEPQGDRLEHGGGCSEQRSSEGPSPHAASARPRTQKE